MQPSSIENGFILHLPRLPNPADSDPAFTRLLESYLPAPVLQRLKPRLSRFGAEAVSDEIYSAIADAERNQPFVRTRNLWGERYAFDRLVTSEGWRKLGAWGIENGVVSSGYEDDFGPYRRLVQHSLNYIYSASSAVYSCPVSMTSGAARLIQQQLPGLPSEHPFHEVYRRLTARKNNWISSQWMTERPGGSDVQNSETFALYSPLPTEQKRGDMQFDEGDYLVYGYKFFCSATDCDIALMLAKTDESGQLSLFIAPTKKTVRESDGSTIEVTNGIRFHRLKNKMGTKELPTAELELREVRAWLVGPLNRGVATIATLLNVTRTHNFITALSCWRRGIAIAKGFAKARSTINQPLWTFPMHLRLLAGMELKFRGLLQLAFFTISLLSFVDNGFPSQDTQSHYAPLPAEGEQIIVVQRTLTAAGKAVICKISCLGLQECQEGMGGVGYMDEPDEPEANISRLYRDTAANMTWEGTTNVLASEVVRHLAKEKSRRLFSKWLEDRVLSSIVRTDIRDILLQSWAILRTKLERAEHDLRSALAEARETMFSLVWVVSGALLAHDAQRDEDADAMQIARRWVVGAEGAGREYLFLEILDVVAKENKLPQEAAGGEVDGLERTRLDCRLVWGVDLPRDAARGFRDDVPVPSKL